MDDGSNMGVEYCEKQKAAMEWCLGKDKCKFFFCAPMTISDKTHAGAESEPEKDLGKITDKDIRRFLRVERREKLKPIFGCELSHNNVALCDDEENLVNYALCEIDGRCAI